jgi:exosortase/archaeosortase family protein
MATRATTLPRSISHLPGVAHLRGWWRPAALVASIVVAYARPLATLVHEMGYDTPVAYLGLVPPIAFALGCWRYHRVGAVPAPVASLDVGAGGALLILAAMVGAGLPALFYPSAWSHQIGLAAFPLFAANTHLDLLSLPIFAAGMLVLLYGVSALRWAWPAIGYAFLAWPTPYIFLLAHLLPLILAVTARATGQLSAFLPLGATVDPNDGTLYTIATPHGPQSVSIGSVCSGFNSLVAWLLFAVAVCVTVRVQRGGLSAAGRLALWAAIGAVATLLGNVVRIALLFMTAHRSGLGDMFDGVHASLGVGLFALIVLGLLGLLPCLGLTLPQPTAGRGQPAPPSHPNLSPAQGWLLAFLALALATGMLLGIGIIRLALIFLGIYLPLGLYVFAMSIRSRGRGASHRPSRWRAILLAIIAMVIMVGVFMQLWHLRPVLLEQFPSLGWRIDRRARTLVAGPTRRIATVVFAVATIAAGRFAATPLHRRDRMIRAAGRGLLLEWRGAALAAGAILAGTVALGMTTTSVASFDESAPATGSISVADFDSALPEIPGTQRSFVETYEWTKQALGRTSTYNRYRYDVPDGQPFWVDVLTTEDAGALAYHSVRRCYPIHGFIDRGTLSVDIGGGMTKAQIANYIKPDVNQAWSTLYWEQKITRGGRTFYQRIVLLYSLDIPINDAVGWRFGPNNALMQSYAARLLDGLGAQ